MTAISAARSTHERASESFLREEMPDLCAFLEASKTGRLSLQLAELIVSYSQETSAAAKEIVDVFHNRVASCNVEEALQTLNDSFLKRDCLLDFYREQDRTEFYEIFKRVVEAGTYFPHEFASQDELQRCFFAQGAHTFVVRSGSKAIGGFYIKANLPGRSSHIANAGYMLEESARGKGLGGLLVTASMKLAQTLDFRAMQFNMVLSQNSSAIALYKKLGFATIGEIPEAVRNRDGSYQAGLIMHRRL